MNVHSSRESQLLTAAIRLASRVGTDGFSMKALAKEAELAVGTAYRYFDSRESLLAAAYCRCLTEASDVMSSAIREGDAFVTNYPRVWMALYRYCVTMPEVTLCRAQFDRLPSAQNEQVQLHKAQVFTPIAGWLDQAIADGQIKNLPHPVIGALCFEACFSMARLEILQKNELSPDLLEQACRGTLSAILIERTQ